MRISIFLRRSVFILAALATLGSGEPPDLDKTRVIELYDKAFGHFARKEYDWPLQSAGMDVIRRHSGLELFCITRDPAGFFEKTKEILSTISEEFDQDFKVLFVNRLTECPEQRTAFYVQLGDPMDRPALEELLKAIVGSAPPLERLPGQEVRGYTFTLPYPPSQDFLFVETGQPDRLPFETKSIFIEELMHALLRGNDATFDGMFSILGYNPATTGYHDWFDHNPSGLCQVDLILLELVLGDIPNTARRFHSLREHLLMNFIELAELAEQRRTALESLMDERC